MKWLITLLLFVSLSAVAASRDDIRLEDGSLLRVGDTKMAVLSKLGFPDAQQAGLFFYSHGGHVYGIQFDGSGERVKRISRDDD